MPGTMLVVDSGGTHTVWVLIAADGAQKTLETLGMNPNRVDPQTVDRILRTQVKPWLEPLPPESCFFYGAGLGDARDKQDMVDKLKTCLPSDCVLEVDTDMKGAALACLGDQVGVVGILGTGSVAFSFDGEKIGERKGGLGYLLGDEGSGTSLGRALLRRLLNRNLSPDLEEKYTVYSGLRIEELHFHLLHHRRPAAFLADQAPFLARYWDDGELANILEHEFGSFLRNDLMPLIQGDGSPIVLCGGVARNFSSLLMLQCERFGLDHISVLQEPPVFHIAQFLQNKQHHQAEA